MKLAPGGGWGGGRGCVMIPATHRPSPQRERRGAPGDNGCDVTNGSSNISHRGRGLASLSPHGRARGGGLPPPRAGSRWCYGTHPVRLGPARCPRGLVNPDRAAGRTSMAQPPRGVRRPHVEPGLGAGQLRGPVRRPQCVVGRSHFKWITGKKINSATGRTATAHPPVSGDRAGLRLPSTLSPWELWTERHRARRGSAT